MYRGRRSGGTTNKHSTAATALAALALVVAFSQAASAETADSPYGALDANGFGTAPPPRRPLTLRNDGTSRAHEETSGAAHDVSLDIPLVAYTTQAFGLGPGKLGASAFGDARIAPSKSQPLANGGLRIWGSPIDRLVLTLDGQKKEENGKLAPTATAQVRLLGGYGDGWALGVLSRYKTEGFATLEGELEGGVLLSVSHVGFHLDTNLIAGGDFDGHEADGELLARTGYDVLPFLRLGAEGRGRKRLSGGIPLPGNRTWDAFGGAQAMAYADHYFAALTGGPSTVGISDRIGWSVMLTAGGVAF